MDRNQRARGFLVLFVVAFIGAAGALVAHTLSWRDAVGSARSAYDIVQTENDWTATATYAAPPGSRVSRSADAQLVGPFERVELYVVGPGDAKRLLENGTPEVVYMHLVAHRVRGVITFEDGTTVNTSSNALHLGAAAFVRPDTPDHARIVDVVWRVRFGAELATPDTPEEKALAKELLVSTLWSQDLQVVSPDAVASERRTAIATTVLAAAGIACLICFLVLRAREPAPEGPLETAARFLRSAAQMREFIIALALASVVMVAAVWIAELQAWDVTLAGLDQASIDFAWSMVARLAMACAAAWLLMVVLLVRAQWRAHRWPGSDP